MSRRLLIVGNFLSEYTGVRSVCEDLALHLAGVGWQVTTTSKRVPRIQRLAGMMGTTLLRRGRYEVAVVEVYSGPAFFWAEAVAAELRLLRCPVILVLHGGDLPLFSARHQRRVSRLLSRAAVVTAPSDYLREHMKRFRSDIRLIPNGLQLHDYQYQQRAQTRPRLVWLRALHSIYNPLMAVETVHGLVDRYPDVELRMIGPDKGDGTREATLARIHDLGLQNRITVLGSVPKSAVPEALAWGDIFLNTTNIDNTPVTVLEAMACGLCVVSTNVGGIPYLLRDGSDALLVPPNEPRSMVDAVTRVLDDPELAESLRFQGRRRVENFGWSTIIPQWESLLMAIGARQKGDLDA